MVLGFAELRTRPPARSSRLVTARVDAPAPRLRSAFRDLPALVVAAVLAVAVVGSAAVAVTPRISSSASKIVDVGLKIPTDAVLPGLEERSTIYDGDGNLLAVVDREISRRVIPLRRIPRHVQHAVIAAEDRKFFAHPGYDIEGIGRASLANFRAREISEGGSTITQQLAKTQVGADRTLQRKATELRYAIALEKRYSKKQLLQRYLNLVYFGSRAYGIAAASEEFFHTTPPKLKVQQSALLAALIRSPNAADPRTRPGLARQRRNSVLRAMAHEGYIPRKSLRPLLKSPLGVRPSSPKRVVRQRHVVDAIQRELLATEGFSSSREERERLLYFGGLRITTTLDLQMQRAAGNVIRNFLPNGSPTAAIATVDPKTGAIKAIASGLFYSELKYDLPTQGRRQPGSAFKPFVYAAALQDGFPPEIPLTGASPAYFEGVPGWERDCDRHDKDVCGVSNYGGASYGQLDMGEALENSVNTAAAQLTMTVGHERVAKLAGSMNIDIEAATNGRITESIGLGGLDQGVTPLELAAAYSVFANGGQRLRPHLIAKVADRKGRVLYEAKPEGKRILHPAVNAAVVKMMRGVVTRGTGTGAALASWDVAGKTGTTSNNVDAWFAGYTPALSTAVWVGHAQGQIEMPNMTGGSVPASIWREYMTEALDGRLIETFPQFDRQELAARLQDTVVTVPDVVGLDAGEALTRLGKSKLIGDVETAGDATSAGTITWQSPAAGEEASPGEEVLLGFSESGPFDFPIYIPPPLSGVDEVETDGETDGEDP